MSKLRMLHVAKEAGPLRLFMLPLLRRLREQGVDVELACREGGPNYQMLAEAGYPVHALRFGGWGSVRSCVGLYGQLRRLMRRGRYDVLVSHTAVTSWFSRAAGRGLVGASIYFAHGLAFAPQMPPAKRWLIRQMEQIAGRFTDGIIVMNEWDAQACARYKLVRAGAPCTKVPGVGVDISAYVGELPQQDREKIDKELGLGDRPVVLYLARFVKAKRPMDVVEVARRVGPRADFVLVGEGPLRERLQEAAREIGPHVRVVGWSNEAELLVRRCSLLVLPSEFPEGLPRVLLEAGAAGKPTVAYDIRGCRDVIENEKTGLLVGLREIDSLTRACERLINDSTLRARLGEEARRRVEREFGIERAVQCTMDAMSRILATRGLSLGDVPAGGGAAR